MINLVNPWICTQVKISCSIHFNDPRVIIPWKYYLPITHRCSLLFYCIDSREISWLNWFEGNMHFTISLINPIWSHLHCHLWFKQHQNICLLGFSRLLLVKAFASNILGQSFHSTIHHQTKSILTHKITYEVTSEVIIICEMGFIT